MKVGRPSRKLDRHYTYADYRTWPDDERWELIRGVAWNMSPAPSVPHQRVSRELAAVIGAFLGERDTPCEMLAAPMDVFLPADPGQPEDEVDNVVQPDIVVVCDQARVKRRGVWGAPDWIIEILSPHTTRKDMGEKLDLYEERGVREYWIVDPGNRCVQVYRPVGSSYGEPEVHVSPAIVPSATLPGLHVPLAGLFRTAWAGMD